MTPPHRASRPEPHPAPEKWRRENDRLRRQVERLREQMREQAQKLAEAEKQISDLERQSLIPGYSVPEM